MRHTTAAIASLLGLLFLAGCGQTGSLYIPDPEPDEKPQQAAEDKRPDTGQQEEEKTS